MDALRLSAPSVEQTSPSLAIPPASALHHEGTTQALYDAGTARWPSLRLSLEAFAAAVVRHTATGTLTSGRAGGLSPELYLAAACVAADPSAPAILDREYLSKIPIYVARIVGVRTNGSLDDFMQGLRERLLMGQRGRAARLADYSGRGPLGAWLRVVAVRLAIETHRRRDATARGDDEHVACGVDAELDHLRGLHEPTFKVCLEEAFAALAPAERLVLRLTYRERMTGDTVAAALGIDRSNVVRRVVRARASLYAATRDAMKRRIALTDSEFHSVARALAAHVEITLSRVLGRGGEA